MKYQRRVLLVVLTALAIGAAVFARYPAGQLASEGGGSLAVLWTSGDPEVAHRVCFMYAHNAKRRAWFDNVHLIVWGPSAKLLSENEELQKEVKADEAEVEKWKDSKFKDEQIKARLDELISGAEKFRWE